MKLTKRQAVLILGGLVVVGGAITLVFLNLRPKPNAASLVKISVWGTEDKATFANIAAAYPYGTVTYTQIDPANFDAQVLGALAAGTGPDVLEIGNRSLPRWQSILAPMPTTYAQSFGPLQMQAGFPDVVAQDFIVPGASVNGVASPSSLYALPLSIDTLALAYNKDLFNSANIAYAPRTWDDFQADIQKLRIIDDQGNLTRAGAAIGGSAASIPNAADILSLLMLQNGTKMVTNDLSQATFASGVGGAGPAAFNYYLQFANISSPNFTWNDGMGNAIDAFAAGKTAMLFAYQSDLAAIKTKAPFLNIGVAQVPQASGPAGGVAGAGATVAVNYPKYSGFAATKIGQVSAAWYFILYMATTDAVEQAYVNATGKPPALRQEVAADMANPNLAVWASQTLTAKSWYQPDDEKVDGILNTAIANVLGGQADSRRALDQAQAAVSQLMLNR